MGTFMFIAVTIHLSVILKMITFDNSDEFEFINKTMFYIYMILCVIGSIGRIVSMATNSDDISFLIFITGGVVIFVQIMILMFVTMIKD